MTSHQYRLFSWELSYFSGKVRAYLRYKDYFGALGNGFEDILATPDLIQGLLLPATGSPTVPQLLTPDGEWVQDSSEIIDFIEAAHPQRAVIPDVKSPCQRLSSYLIELLADEWMVVYAFWERWYYSLSGVSPNQLDFNAQQWGGFLNSTGKGVERRDAAKMIFEQVMSLNSPGKATMGPYSGLVELGVNERTKDAWIESNQSILNILERHFDKYDYVFGGRPSLADFGLLGPLYAHLYRDAVPGFELRTKYPLVTEWVERTNGTNALCARSYNQHLYSLDAEGQLIPKPANSNNAEWLTDDEIPESLYPLLEVFFSEMWPMLKSTIAGLSSFIKGGEHKAGGELPGKTFTATPGFEHLQRGDGPLTHEFTIRGAAGRRMILPYHVWMLQRIADIVSEIKDDDKGLAGIQELLNRFTGGPELMDLQKLLRGCRIKKEGGLLYHDVNH